MRINTDPSKKDITLIKHKQVCCMGFYEIGEYKSNVMYLKVD